MKTEVAPGAMRKKALNDFWSNLLTKSRGNDHIVTLKAKGKVKPADLIFWAAGHRFVVEQVADDQYRIVDFWTILERQVNENVFTVQLPKTVKEMDFRMFLAQTGRFAVQVMENNTFRVARKKAA